MSLRYLPYITASVALTVSLCDLAFALEIGYTDASTGLQNPAMEGGNTELEFADVDGDGHVDILSIGDHGSPFINTSQHGIMVWFGDGTGQWSVFQNGNFGYGGIAVGDVNNDGFMDVGYGMHHNYSGTDLGDQLLEVALGDGTGMNWTAWDDGLAANGESWGMFGTDFADVDSDGDLDIGSLSFGCCAGIHVYVNQGDGTWVQTFGLLGGNSSASQFTFGDVNGDGHADFAAAHGDGTVYLGDGRGGFALADGNLPGGSWRTGVSLGDINNDGFDDLSFRNSSGVQVWSWDGSSWQDYSGSLAGIGSFALTEIADMNLDGHGDVVIFKEDLIVVYAGDGTGNWEQIASIATPDACDDAALRAGTDVDHNGYPDIAIVSEENCQIFTGGINRPRVYVETTIPTEPWVFPSFPRGGEHFHAGSVISVRWHAAVPDGQDNPTVTLELSLEGPDGPWSEVATGLVNNGHFQWSIPSVLPESTEARLRYTLSTIPSATATTAGSFHIIGEVTPGDLDGNGEVDIDDLLLLLASWGPCDGCSNCPADLDGDCIVGTNDLLILLSNWE